jgi:hypothetical protein
MKISKSKISIAMGAVLSATCFAPVTSYAVSFDVLNGAISDGDAGDALLFPFYSTTGTDGNNVTTSFSVTNTANNTVAVKIRFREQRVSYDVFDMIAVLSPYDKFDFWVAPGENGRPRVAWNDSTCVVGPQPGEIGAQPDGGTSIEFPDPATYRLTGTGITNEDMAVGHVEVLGMARLDGNSCVNATTGEPAADCLATNGNTSLKAASTHAGSGDARAPANCRVVMDFFSNPEFVQLANADTSTTVTPFFTDMPNSLIGRYVVTVPNRGIEAGDKAIAIQNSNLTNAGAAGLPIHVVAQSPALCADLGPFLGNHAGNCKNTGYAWDTQEYAHPHLGDMTNLANLQGQLNALPGGFGAAVNDGGISGDWSVNPANHVSINWIVSLPNKYTYLNLVAANECDGSGTAKVWCLLDKPPVGIGGAHNVYREAAGDTNAADTLPEVNNNTVTGGTETEVVADIDIDGDGIVNVDANGDGDFDDEGDTADTGDVVTVTVADGNVALSADETTSGVAVNVNVLPTVNEEVVTTTTQTVGNNTITTTTTTDTNIGAVNVDQNTGAVTMTVNINATTVVSVTNSVTGATNSDTSTTNVANNIVVTFDENGISTTPVNIGGNAEVYLVLDMGGDGVMFATDDTGKVITDAAGKPHIKHQGPIKAKNNAYGQRSAATKVGQDLGVSSPIAIYGTEEQKATSYTISPGGSSVSLDQEVNVISFGSDDSLIANRVTNVTVQTDTLGDNRGWAYLPMNKGVDSVVGLNFTLRATEDPTQNNGTIIELNKTLKP